MNYVWECPECEAASATQYLTEPVNYDCPSCGRPLDRERHQPLACNCDMCAWARAKARSATQWQW